MSLAGKTVVVTGASSGIGRALCLELSPQRPRLVLAARDQERLEQVARLCESAGAVTLVVRTDVSSHHRRARLRRVRDPSPSDRSGRNPPWALADARVEDHDGRDVCSPHRHAMETRKRLWIGSARGRLVRWARLGMPGLIDRLAAKAIGERG